MPAQQNSGRSDASLIGNLHNRCCSKQRATSAAQRAVSSNMDTLFFAEIDNLLLRQRWVVFDLVHSRNDSCLGQKLLEVFLAVVGDTNSFDLACVQELLHALPGGGVRVRVDEVAGAIGVLRKEGVVSCRLLVYRFISRK